MRVLSVYGRIYADCLRQALLAIRKNPWTLLLPVGLLVARGFASSLILSLGAIGRFLEWIVTAAALSCYLFFLGEVVAKTRVRPGEFAKSVGPYFWSVANLFFVFWIASLLLGMVTAGTPNAPTFAVLLQLAAVILLNASPEMIYQRGSYGGLETARRSIAFLQANWIEWGIPNLLFLAMFQWFPDTALFSFGPLGGILDAVLKGALFHVAMVFRGYLFAELDGTSHRQRMYRWRAAGSA
jgi:hypothetical protein